MTEEVKTCMLCKKPIDTQKDDYEILETFIEGKFEDKTYCHFQCSDIEDAKNKVQAILNLSESLLQGQRLIKLITRFAEHPQAMNYLTFEAWAKDMLRVSKYEKETEAYFS